MSKARTPRFILILLIFCCSLCSAEENLNPNNQAENNEEIQSTPANSSSRYDHQILCSQAQFFVEQNNYQEAIGVYTQLVEAYPEYTYIRYLRAMLNHELGNIEEAREDYEFLLAHNDLNLSILNNLGAIYASNKDYEKAIDYFTQGISELSHIPEAHLNLAEAFMITKNYDAAINHYNNVIVFEPDNSDALFNLGVAYLKKGDYDNAQLHWEKALAISPQDIDVKAAWDSIVKARATQ